MGTLWLAVFRCSKRLIITEPYLIGCAEMAEEDIETALQGMVTGR